MISEKKDRVVGSSSSSNTAGGEKLEVRKYKLMVRTLDMPIAQRRLPHIAKFYGALRARVHEEVAMHRVELRRSDNFRQLLHVHGLDVHNVYMQSCIALESNKRVNNVLKLWSLMFMFHRLIRRSSAEIYVSPSELIEIEFI